MAIVGGGFTGLWTAYYLLREDPSLQVDVLEAETAGFGASGRNGGWCSALFPSSLRKLASLSGSSQEAALAQHRAMRAAIDEIAEVVRSEGIEAHFHKGGTISLSRTKAQWRRAQADVSDARTWGRGEDDLRLLQADEASHVLRATKVKGATYTPDCAAVHPVLLC
ncbi:MAG: FAD-binding oxidoreductase, partial [Actinomycetota bacterium]|nr:FAD-binding oxidoreductase [Actinomycetota bacterium]